MNIRFALFTWLAGAALAGAALISCPECKKEISDRASACPNCGLPGTEFHKNEAAPKPEQKTTGRPVREAAPGPDADSPLTKALSQVANKEDVVRIPKAEIAEWAGEGFKGDHLPDGTPHGVGRMNRAGTSYFGEWAFGKRHGLGSYTNTAGDSYKGYWKDDQKAGSGLYVWASGAMYSGRWVNNMMDGEGKYKFPDGSVFRGTWKSNVIDGQGTLTRTDGTVVKMTYQEGKVVWSADVNSDTFNYNPDANGDGDISDEEMSQFEKRRKVYELRMADRKMVEDKMTADQRALEEGAQAKNQGKQDDFLGDATQFMNLLKMFK